MALQPVVLTQGKHFLVWCPLVVSQVSIQIGMFLCKFLFFFSKFRKVNKRVFLGKEEVVLRVPLLSGKIIRTTICWTPDMLHSPSVLTTPKEQDLQWSPSHTWIAEAHMIPDQTADTEYSEGSKLYLHGEVMDAFSWPHCLMGRPARRSDFPAPWQLSNQNNRPGAPCYRTLPVCRGHRIWVIGRLQMEFFYKTNKELAAVLK